MMKMLPEGLATEGDVAQEKKKGKKGKMAAGARSGGAAPTPQGFPCLGARSRGAARAATTAR